MGLHYWKCWLDGSPMDQSSVEIEQRDDLASSDCDYAPTEVENVFNMLPSGTEQTEKGFEDGSQSLIESLKDQIRLREHEITNLKELAMKEILERKNEELALKRNHMSKVADFRAKAKMLATL